MIATARILTVTNLAGITEPLTDFSSFSRTRSLNNEQTLSLTVFPTDRNREAFQLVEEEALLDFDGDTYVIKKVNERSVGRVTVKQIDAVHKFYVDLANKQQRTVYNGTITFNDYMKLVFDGTGYTFLAVDSFSDQDFDNLGNDSRLALLQKAIERWGCEFKLVGNEVRFYKQIGDDIDFQFRYGYNIKTIQRDVDTTNLRTVIHGSGANGIELAYRSPNADIFGEIEAPAIDDDRFTTEESLLEEMKSQLQDTPEMSITIDFADLRAAGYPYDFPEIGDRVFVIYEPMNNLRIETRLIEVTEEFDVNFRPIQTSVTLANVQKSLASTLLNTVNNALSRIANDDGTIKFDFLDQAVKQATQALQSAQTELEFNNGIIARDKNDANNIVVFNSAGLGISSDGGRTFRTALTGSGLVAETIVGSKIIGISLTSVDEKGVFTVMGSNAKFVDNATGNSVQLSADGLYGYNNDNSVRFQADSILVTSRALGTTTANVYLAAQSDKEARVVDITDVPSDGEIESYTYLPLRTRGLYGNFVEVNKGVSGVNLYLRPRSGGEVRITGAGTTDAYYPLRAGEIYCNTLITTTTSMWLGTDSAVHIVNKGFAEDSSGDPIYRDIYANDIYNHALITRTTNAYIGTDDELRIVNKGLSGIYRNVRAYNYFGNALDVNGGTNLYLRPASDGEVMVTKTGTTDTFLSIRALGFLPPSSTRESKKEIEEYTDNVLDSFRNVKVYKFLYNWENDDNTKRLGIMLDEAPEIIYAQTKDTIDIYSMTGYLWRGLSCHIQETDALKEEIQDLVKRVSKLEAKVNG